MFCKNFINERRTFPSLQYFNEISCGLSIIHMHLTEHPFNLAMHTSLDKMFQQSEIKRLAVLYFLRLKALQKKEKCNM